MKLLFCTKCQDVFRLTPSIVPKYCKCGAVNGKCLEDGLNAVFWGPGVPLGFDNASLTHAIKNQPESGKGIRFEAFVVPKICATFNKLQTYGDR